MTCVCLGPCVFGMVVLVLYRGKRFFFLHVNFVVYSGITSILGVCVYLIESYVCLVVTMACLLTEKLGLRKVPVLWSW